MGIYGHPLALSNQTLEPRKGVKGLHHRSGSAGRVSNRQAPTLEGHLQKGLETGGTLIRERERGSHSVPTALQEGAKTSQKGKAGSLKVGTLAGVLERWL